MKAMVYQRYGPPEVLELKDVAQPIPKAKEVLIKVHASTVTAGDCEVRRFDLPPLFWLPVRLMIGLIKPRIQILGQELSGEVVAVGKEVTGFQLGDAVFGPVFFGAYAEFRCQKANGALAHKPTNMRFEEAATLATGGLNALHFLNKAQVKAGEKVLINGAGGSIGTYSVQVAKSMGAEVTAVDSTQKLEMLRSIGADHVIDFTKESFTDRHSAYDVIFDAVGKTSYSSSLKSLKPNGRFVSANPNLSLILRSFLTRFMGSKKAITGLAGEKMEDLKKLKSLAEEGKIRAIIDRKYPLTQLADAHRYVETDQKAGNVVINIGNK